MNGDNLLRDSFDPCDWTVIKIIGKYYPHLKNRKELSLLTCIARTMKDCDWSVAEAQEVQLRMTENLIFEGSDGCELVDAAAPANLLQPYEYNEILSHLISAKIV